jgi:hypothetical protein
MAGWFEVLIPAMKGAVVARLTSMAARWRRRIAGVHRRRKTRTQAPAPDLAAGALLLVHSCCNTELLYAIQLHRTYPLTF